MPRTLRRFRCTPSASFGSTLERASEGFNGVPAVGGRPACKVKPANFEIPFMRLRPDRVSPGQVPALLIRNDEGKRSDDAFRDDIFQRQHAAERFVERVSPGHRACRHVHELRAYPHAIVGATHSAVEDRINLELPAGSDHVMSRAHEWQDGLVGLTITARRRLSLVISESARPTASLGVLQQAPRLVPGLPDVRTAAPAGANRWSASCTCSRPSGI